MNEAEKCGRALFGARTSFWMGDSPEELRVSGQPSLTEEREKPLSRVAEAQTRVLS